MHNFNTGKVVGRATEKVWVGVESFQLPGDNDRVRELGVVVEVSSGDQYVNLGAFGRELIVRTKEKLTSNEGDTGEKLKAVIAELESEMRQIGWKMVVMTRLGSGLVAAIKGDGLVSLYRGGVWGKLAKGGEEVVVVGGNLKNGDVVLAGTNDLYMGVGWVRLKEIWTEVGEVGEGLVVNKAERMVEKVVVEMQRNVSETGWGALVWEWEEVGQVENETELKLPKKRIGVGRVVGEWLRKVTQPKGITIKVRGDISEREKRRRKVGVLVFGVLLLLLGVSVVLGWQKRSMQEKERKLVQVLAPAQALYDQALVEEKVNRLRARSLLAEAKQKLESERMEMKEGSGERMKLEGLLAQVSSKYQQVSGEEKVELKVFLDLRLVKDDFYGNRLGAGDGKVVILDATKGEIVEVASLNKQSKVVASGGDIGGGKLVATANGEDFVLADTGVIKLRSDNDTKKVVVKKDEEWVEVVGLGVYGSSIYVVDRKLSEIWKYAIKGEEAVRTRWLAPGISPDFGQVVDMAIDGDIWVADSNGQVRHYSRGASTGFKIEDWGGELREVTALAVSGEKLYVLDMGGKRLVVFNQEGIYEKQLAWEADKVVTEVEVVGEEGDKKILLLAGNVIYEVGIE